MVKHLFPLISIFRHRFVKKGGSEWDGVRMHDWGVESQRVLIDVVGQFSYAKPEIIKKHKRSEWKQDTESKLK